MPGVSESACIYAALILHDDGVEVSADNITTLVKAANVDIEAYWPSLFAKLLQKVSISDLIGSMTAAPVAVAAAPVAGGVAPAAGGAAAAAPIEEEKEEEEEEEDEDMGMDLFGGGDDDF